MKPYYLALLGLFVCISPLFCAEGLVYVSEPFIPTISPPVSKLPPPVAGSNPFGMEMQRRQDYGFLGPDQQGVPWINPLAELQDRILQTVPRQINAFSTPILNFAGATSPSSPPDTTGDVGPNHFLQAVNDTSSTNSSTIRIFNKSGVQIGSDFELDSLASGPPCNNGFCDPIVLYDKLADRWIISEFPSSGGHLCVYVSTSPDPTGTWYAYAFLNVESSTPDYPKYGVWPLDTNGDGQYLEGSYVIGINAGSGGRDVVALDRAKMLQGLPATFQKFTAPSLPAFGFQLFLPGNFEGSTPPPPGNQPAIFLRPVDTEINSGYSCSPTPCDVMEIWALTVDWATPANSSFTRLPDIKIAEYDHTLCGTGSIWNCMPQPGTSQKLDPIREPIHFPLQYRNFGSYQTLVGCFAEDVDGTDRAGVHWFEIRKTGSGNWTLNQEGVLGTSLGASVNRSVCSAAMDQSGNIAVGYTRTGSAAPYYPSIYYAGRLATDPPNTMPQFEYAIQNATNSNTDNERWGDYSGIGVDPSDDCTFWYVTEYGGSGQTKIASFKFDQCGCLSVPAAPNASISIPGPNQLNVSWNDSATPSITRYWVYRSTTPGGPYTQIAEVADTSPGVGGGPGYTYQDTTVSGGTHYYYVVKSNDSGACTSNASNEVDAVATGQCTLAPSFAGLSTVSNPGNASCALNLSWAAGTASCSGPLQYVIYRSTSSPVPITSANIIASGVTGTSFTDTNGLVSGTTYYYVVHARDVSNGVEESNSVEKNGAPSGPSSTFTITETFEGFQSGGGFDNPGWNHNPVNGTVDWVWSTAQSQTPAHSWFSSSQTSVSDRVLISQTFTLGATTTLNFWHTYDFEGTTSTCYDGGTLEITTNGGSTWTVIPDSAFTSGGFTGTVNSGYSNPIAGKRAWCDGTIGAMTQVNVNLGSFAGSTVRLRWHEGDDSSIKATGWYVDSVTITNAVTSASCSTPNPKEVSPAGDMTLAKATGSAVTVTYTPACGGSNNTAYRGTSTGTMSGISWNQAYCNLGNSGTATFDPGTPAPGQFYYFVIAANNSTTEGSYGMNSSSVQRPEANGLTCDYTLNLSGTCP